MDTKCTKTKTVVLLLAEEKRSILKSVLVKLPYYRHAQDERVKEKLSELFDTMMEFLDGISDDNLTACGRDVAKFREDKGVNFEEFLNSFDETRFVVAEYIEALPIEKSEKNEALLRLNEFFLLIQKQTCLHSAHLSNIQLKKKEELLHSLEEDRMEILGRISTSFAHEFRNPLTSIKGFVQLLERRMPEDLHEKAYIDYINHEIEGLEENVNQFLMLSNTKNHQDELSETIWFHHLLLSVTEAFRPVCSENDIRLTLEISDTLITKGSEEQLRLAVMKIIHNAVDALMYVNHERTIFIRGQLEDNLNKIYIENNGPKIPDYLLETIFDPFVSTKELGKGLGLSVCKQIIEKHGGTLQCVSGKEKTTFEICLPYG
ncbi:sensor histidine kinase [Alteribacter keqinensis]|uniref:histidine kinase n=1 Tax=Alteribacter keqinensis TaxID=2483800 RepID=A0A3M7TU25_9BACI|nr:HAMP domain-containing sensor histidine kinase [Alteribacter keqinensis]RNA68731.1 sensor histidine kinase [Alteribacter keqinensis]